MKVLDQNVGDVGLERDAIFDMVSKRRSGEVFQGNHTISIVDHRVLDNNICRTIKVPIEGVS